MASGGAVKGGHVLNLSMHPMGVNLAKFEDAMQAAMRNLGKRKEDKGMNDFKFGKLCDTLVVLAVIGGIVAAIVSK